MCVCVYLVSKKRDHQGAVDVTECEPDQNHDQVLDKRCGESISDQQQLIQQRETRNSVYLLLVSVSTHVKQETENNSKQHLHCLLG